MPSYDRYAAAAYAVKYALRENPDYSGFKDDCTNFVSQCLLAGGWTMVGGSFTDRKDDDVWWFGKSHLYRASFTWGGAANLSKFIAQSGRGVACLREELDVGDVFQLMEATGRIYHSMIVTSHPRRCTPDGNGPFLSGHNHDRLNKDLGKILSELDSGVVPLYWKIYNQYTA